MIIVGLGNPDKQYENTYHNLGFAAIDVLLEKLGKKLKTSECSSLTTIFSLNGQNIILAKPLTYMNLSGQAVKSLLSKYNQTANDLIVIYDDFDIPRFSVRIRESGSAGTHNGMRNIVSMLGNGEFKRVRIGIGGTEYDKKDYVLSQITKEDKAFFDVTLSKLCDALIQYLKDNDFNRLMRTIN